MSKFILFLVEAIPQVIVAGGIAYIIARLIGVHP